MSENNGFFGLAPLDEMTTEILYAIIEMTPEKREKLLELWNEVKKEDTE